MSTPKGIRKQNLENAPAPRPWPCSTWVRSANVADLHEEQEDQP